jgi:hypothetical protein
MHVQSVVRERGSCAHSRRLVVCNLGPALAPAAAVHVKIAVRVAPNLPSGSSLSNAVRVRSPSDTNPENDVVTALTAIR